MQLAGIGDVEGGGFAVQRLHAKAAVIGRKVLYRQAVGHLAAGDVGRRTVEGDAVVVVPVEGAAVTDLKQRGVFGRHGPGVGAGAAVGVSLTNADIQRTAAAADVGDTRVDILIVIHVLQIRHHRAGGNRCLRHQAGGIKHLKGGVAAGSGIRHGDGEVLRTGIETCLIEILCARRDGHLAERGVDRPVNPRLKRLITG